MTDSKETITKNPQIASTDAVGLTCSLCLKQSFWFFSNLCQEACKGASPAKGGIRMTETLAPVGVFHKQKDFRSPQDPADCRAVGQSPGSRQRREETNSQLK